MRQLRIIQQVTNRQDVSLDKYLLEISRLPLISAGEEIELAARIRRGDNAAIEKLTVANLRFVVSVSKQYQHQGLSLSDLINEGNLGLIRAASRFDETRGFKFISYAVWWIRQSILQALAGHARLVRLPQNKITAITRVSKLIAELEQEYERPPSDRELADALQLHETDIRETLKMSGRHVSMDEALSDNEDSTSMSDLMAAEDEAIPDNSLMAESLRTEIERSLSALCPREAEVLRCSFGLNSILPMSLDEIAGKLELSRERVRQIREAALRRLKHGQGRAILRTYLG